MKKKWKIHLGYLFMLLALFIPLVTFGRMAWQHQFQFEAYSHYRKTVETRDSQALEVAAQAYNDKLRSNNNIVDPFLAEGHAVDYHILEHPDEVYGYLSIPSLELVAPVYLGASPRNMDIGLAHVDGTSLPLKELGLRSVIAGHRGEASHVFFRHLDKLVVGDRLYFDNGQEILTYQMVSSEVIMPSEWEKLLPVEGENWLTLLTCDPIPIYNKRLLINFERVEEEPQKTEQTSQAFSKEGRNISKVATNQWLYKLVAFLSLLGQVLLIGRYIRFYCRK